MKKTKFAEAQIVFALRQSENGASVQEICRKMGISEATFYNWKKKWGGCSRAQALKTAGRREFKIKTDCR